MKNGVTDQEPPKQMTGMGHLPPPPTPNKNDVGNSYSTSLKKCSLELFFFVFFFFFFSDRNTFCLLTNSFQSFLKFLCLSPTFFSCGVNLTFVRGYISGFCPYVPMSGGLMSYTHTCNILAQCKSLSKTYY